MRMAMVPNGRSTRRIDGCRFGGGSAVAGMAGRGLDTLDAGGSRGREPAGPVSAGEIREGGGH